MLLLFIKNCIFNTVPQFFHVFPVMKLRSPVPNSYIHECVCLLFIPKISLPIWLQQNMRDQSWEYIKCSQIHIWCGNWETEHCNNVLEYINRIQTFILDVVSSLRFTTANHHPLKMGSANDDMSYAIIGFSQIPG